MIHNPVINKPRTFVARSKRGPQPYGWRNAVIDTLLCVASVLLVTLVAWMVVSAAILTGLV